MKSPRMGITYAVLAALLTAMATACGGEAPAVQADAAADAEPAGDTSGEAEIDTDTGEVSAGTEDGAITFGGEDLPEGFPAQMPIYPGGQKAAGLSQVNDGVLQLALSYTFGLFDEAEKEDPETVLDFYREQLPANGWTVDDLQREDAIKILKVEGHGFTGSVQVADSAGTTTLSISLERPA